MINLGLSDDKPAGCCTGGVSAGRGLALPEVSSGGSKHGSRSAWCGVLERQARSTTAAEQAKKETQRQKPLGEQGKEANVV